MSDPKINSIGMEIFIETGIDLTGNTSLQIRYTKPDASTGVFDADVKIIGSKIGATYITTTTADIDQEGVWTFQVRATGNGYELYGNQVTQNFIGVMPGTF